MSITAEPTEIDTDKLMSFVFRAVDEVGATLNAALVVMGDKLGYYRDLAENGPSTAAQLAERTRTAEPYAREWLNAQAAGAYVTYDPATKRYTLPPEHALAMTDPDSAAFLPGFFQIALGTVHDTQHIVDAARSGAGYGWHQHDTDVHVGCERFFRPSYHANLIDTWIPALDGVEQKLRDGALVADVGCGHGASTILHGAGVPELDLRRVGLPRRVHRHRTLPRDGGGCAQRALRGRLRAGVRRHPARPATSSWPCSTACTTWAIRSALRVTCAMSSPMTAPGWSSSRWPETTSKTT